MNTADRTNRLLLYIGDQRQFGKSDNEIRTSLIEEGYTTEYVDSLFVHLAEGTTAPADLANPVDETNDNGLGSFGIGVGLIVAVTVITWVVLQFTDSWSLIFWGFSLIGIWGMVKGIYFGMTYPDSGQAKAARLGLYAVGVVVVGVCAFWTWTTFFQSGPPMTEVDWSQSTARPVGIGNAVRFNGTISNNAEGWRMVDLELTVTPINNFGEPIRGSSITFDPAPIGIGPQLTLSYSETVNVPRSSTGFEEELNWGWEKD